LLSNSLYFGVHKITKILKLLQQKKLKKKISFQFNFKEVLLIVIIKYQNNLDCWLNTFNIGSSINEQELKQEKHKKRKN
jgi:hypothetical protein